MGFFDDARSAFQQQQQAPPAQPRAPIQDAPPGSRPPSPPTYTTGGRSSPPLVPTGGGGNQGPIPWGQVMAGLDPNDPASLGVAVQRLQALGYNAEIVPQGRSGTRRNPDGSLQMSGDKISVNGQGYDLIENATGTGPANWMTNPLRFTVGGGAASGSGAPGAGAANSPYADGSALAPWTKDFTSPSGEQAMNHPGFQYAMDRAQQAIERSAASKGTLLTGGLLRDLSENQVGMAMQQYGNLRDWMRDDYMIDRQNFMDNQDRPWAKLSGLATAGRPQ